MKKGHIIVDGLDVRYAEQGTGRVVLLLHGWGTNLHTFDKLINNWNAKGKRFIAIDLPGFGDSEPPHVAWDVSAYTSFVQSFLNKINVSQLHIIVGHSLGGRIAIKGVSEGILSPEKLVLIASAGTAASNSIRNNMFMMVAKIGKAIMSIPPLSFFKSTFRKKLYIAAGSKDYLYAGNMKNTFLNIVRENLTKAAQKINIPTVLVWGEQDTETPLAEARTLHDAIRGSELIVIPNASHFVHEEKPQKVAQAAITFTAL